MTAEHGGSRPDYCCPGEPAFGDPNGLHTHDCPVYQANVDALERSRAANDRRRAEEYTQDRIRELAGKVVDARLALADAIRDACPKPHAFVQHRDHQPAWCNTCGRGENGVRYGRTTVKTRMTGSA